MLAQSVINNSPFKQTYAVTLEVWVWFLERGGLNFLQYLWFYWSDFDKQGLILKLRSSSIRKFAKISCARIACGRKSRKFPVAKISCSTVLQALQLCISAILLIMPLMSTHVTSWLHNIGQVLRKLRLPHRNDAITLFLALSATFWRDTLHTKI